MVTFTAFITSLAVAAVSPPHLGLEVWAVYPVRHCALRRLNTKRPKGLTDVANIVVGKGGGEKPRLWPLPAAKGGSQSTPMLSKEPSGFIQAVHQRDYAVDAGAKDRGRNALALPSPHSIVDSVTDNHGRITGEINRSSTIALDNIGVATVAAAGPKTFAHTRAARASRSRALATMRWRTASGAIFIQTALAHDTMGPR